MQLKKGIIGTLLVAATVVPTLAYGQAYGTVTTQKLNVRDGAKTSATLVAQVTLGDSVEIVAEEGDWFKIALSDGSRAFVKGEYVTVHRADGVVNTSSLNVRDYPSTSTGTVIKKITAGQAVSVQYAVDEWYKISQDGMEGFVHKDYIDVDLARWLPTKSLSEVSRVKNTPITTSSSAASNTVTTSSSISSSKQVSGNDVVNYAKQFLGNPYVYGGNSLTTGVDCSGFTTQVMKNFGINLKRSSSEQYASNGYAVSADNLQKGDLLFYGYNGNVSHVAIYIGDGQVIHANDEKTGICISGAYSGKPFIGAKRVL